MKPRRRRGRARRAATSSGCDDLVDGMREPGARPGCDFMRQPVRPVLRLRDDDDLLGGERPQRVLDRKQRVRVADAAGRGHARRREYLERALEPLRGGAARAVLCGRPEGDPAVQRGRDDEDLGVVQVHGRVDSVAVVGLAGVALIHVLDAHDTFVATPYKGWLYVGLIAGSLLAAGALVRRNDTRAWAAAGALSLAAFLAFVYSRTVGLPASADDIGNWWEPLGLSSLFVEGSLVALSAAMLSATARVAVPVRSRRAAAEGSLR